MTMIAQAPTQEREVSEECPAWGWRVRRVFTEFGAPIDTPIPDMEVFLQKSTATSFAAVWTEESGGWSHEFTVGTMFQIDRLLRGIAISLTEAVASS
ncbi:hypothetical protein [Agromyces albus]|uniref:hypothetical protein n=1 Tax=Agromyces albus TaxID=205332 RepID=UPI0027D7CCC5|nr:hypothetical protein [Agromyces albus]